MDISLGEIYSIQNGGVAIVMVTKVGLEGLVLIDVHPSMHMALGNPEAHCPSCGQIQGPWGALRSQRHLPSFSEVVDMTHRRWGPKFMLLYPKWMKSVASAEQDWASLGTLDVPQFAPYNHFLIYKELYRISRFVVKLLCIYNRGSFRGCCFIYEPNVYKKNVITTK